MKVSYFIYVFMKKKKKMVRKNIPSDHRLIYKNMLFDGKDSSTTTCIKYNKSICFYMQ